MEQRYRLAEAKRLLETGELFPRGTAEEPHAPNAEAEATDSEPEAHVLEPLADDHSSDGEDTPTGVEEAAALLPSRFARKKNVHNPGPGARVSAQRYQRARACPCQSRRCRHLLVAKELSFVVASLSIHSACCFRVSSRSSPVRLRRHHQEWSLRLNSIQHWKTHQVLT